MTWKKYAHLFPSQSHIFLFYENEEKDLCEITLINKKAFYQIVEKHKNKFEHSADRLLKLIVEKKSIWNTSLKDRVDLIGILLGYGAHNAELFCKRDEIDSRKHDLKKRRTQPSPGYDSIEAELNALQERLQSFSDEGRYTICLMRLPGFTAERNHAETVELKHKYREQRKHITQLYLQQNILEITLDQLCQ